MNFLGLMRQKARERAKGIEIAGDHDSLPIRSFRDALTGRGLAIIAEVKYATPAEGSLGVRESPAELARAYEDLGARAVSCLTEPEYFHGRAEYIALVRGGCSLPVLMKDFIVDERQVRQGRSLGADAVLLITEMLETAELTDLYSCACALGMDCLVEVHGQAGLEKALALGATIIGVNCRDLETLQVVPRRHEEMAPLLPQGVIKVAESGIDSRRRLGRLLELGYDAALIGRAFASHKTRGEIFRVGEDMRDHKA